MIHLEGDFGQCCGGFGGVAVVDVVYVNPITDLAHPRSLTGVQWANGIQGARCDQLTVRAALRAGASEGSQQRSTSRLVTMR